MMDRGIRSTSLERGVIFSKSLQAQFDDVKGKRHATEPRSDDRPEYSGRKEIIRSVRLLCEDVINGRVRRIDEGPSGDIFTAGDTQP